MADLTKFKRKSSLGDPPPLSEASVNLEAPEVAPAPPPARLSDAAAASLAQGRAGEPEQDGRTARRTGRTVQFATRVSEPFAKRLRTVARRDRLLLVEVLEQALDAYETQRQCKGSETTD